MSKNLKYIILIIVFFALQTIWFNHVLFLNKYIPIIFIYPLLIMPVFKNETQQLLSAFFYGLALDIISNTGGVFAATAVFVTYTRKLFFLIGKSPAQDFDQIQIGKFSFPQKIIYYYTFILLSQILIYLLESFNLELLISKSGYIFINSLISLLFIIIIDYLFFNTENK